MAKHEITIRENLSATSATVPFLGNYVTKDTIKLDAFASAIAAKCGLPAIQAQAILSGCLSEIAALEKESLVRIHLDGFSVAGVIKGSFPSADAAFNPEKNALNLAIRLDDDVKLEIADETGTIVTDETTTKVRVDNVVDVAVPRPTNLIHGQHVFRVQGLNLVTTDAGGGIYLENALGATFPCVVDEQVSNQLVKAHTASLLEAGDYKLHVKSRGGDAQGPIQNTFRKVKYLYIANPPQINSASQPDRPMNQIWANTNAPFEIFGNYLALGSTDQVIVEALDGDGATADSINVTSAVTASSDTRIAVSGIDMSKASDPALWVMHGGRIVIVRAGSRYEHSIQLVAEE